MKTKIKIALVGQPNVGKSMLINSISNSRLKVGNFSGVTVEKKEINFFYKEFDITIVDLPGSYSLTNYSIEEKVVNEFLYKNNYDIILNVVDSTNLQRNLLLTTELMALNKKIVIALNMSDEAKKESILIDEKKLSNFLNIACVKTSAKTKDGLDKLLEEIIKTYKNKELSNIDISSINQRFEFCKNAVKECVSVDSFSNKSVTQKIDSILMNKYLGIPIFLLFMWILFQLTFTLGAVPMDYIDIAFSTISLEIKNLFGENQLSLLLSDGIVAGVGAVVMFLPNILILFLGISLLESTGYMSRVAFLLDGIFHKFGLHGKSFIPLVTGFGCSVPAYMAARTLKNQKDRLITLFIIGFMSCGARLPIYVLFAGAFFSTQSAGNILFIIYISGAIFGLFAAKILRVVVFKSVDEPFVMEMPKYRLPSFRFIYKDVINKGFMYLKKAGTFILAASVLIWFMSNYPKNLELQEEFESKIELAATKDQKIELQNELDLYNLENSYLGVIGKFSEPLFTPLGFDWKMTVALEAGLAAKEVVVTTLSILYKQGANEDPENPSEGLVEKIKQNIPFESAISFIVFVMLYIPCLAAAMVFTKEAGSWKYLLYLFIFTTTTAWIVSFLAYNITKLVVA
ncbi:ferrous iron transport protein B [Aliarcobacter skirrowii]|uniref:Ferrous iron transport protein B n=2 Tax=Aliarcobacter skirrowii TaxID=28200 RepID=A0A2U2BZ37_9BACT|nr:ferrous iron transport protein B [Aliarcobacter skirrowii]PWE20101.1 ferrous iron transport protein B [Aliarcobacter skirrowii]PWE20194.1 ferrous iron transport protein B [Aliarcobacter skirrowii]PWE26344.1 ferrous iron transport protein B [Aliarcobacter skirrowii]RJO55548.1 ferrous iron transport protein B [Aliarcobacter skirrowii]RJO57503.1 ferrous iron transport protein B [Aliarcobacter skirrowii]